MEYIQVNLSSLDTSSVYIGDNKDVSYKLNQWEPWVNYGPNNDLPYYLSSLATAGGSTTHFANLRLKKTLTAGGGFLFDKNNIKLKEFIERNNANKLLEDLAWERVIFNSSAIQVGYTNGKITNIWNLTIPSLRVPNTTEYNIQYFYISKDWRRLHEPGNQFMKVDSYHSNSTSNLKILYDYTSTPNNYYYAVEDYRNAIPHISTEANLGKHMHSVTINSMTPSGLLSINDTPKPEQMQEFKRDVSQQFTGVENSGKVLVMFYGNDKEKPEFQPLMGTNVADIYNSISQHVQQSILTCHGLNNPQLAGLPGGGSIFTDSLSTSFEYFQRMIIKDYQKPILAMFAKIFIDAGLINDESEIAIKSLSPTQFVFDKDTMDSNLLRNEIRSLGGFEPVEKISDNIEERFAPGTLDKIFSIIDSTLSKEQKVNRLKLGYGLSDEEINKLMVGIEDNIQPSDNNEKKDDSFLSKMNPFKKSKQ